MEVPEEVIIPPEKVNWVEVAAFGNGYEKDARPRDEVAVRVYPPRVLPTSRFPYDGEVVSPVPP